MRVYCLIQWDIDRELLCMEPSRRVGQLHQSTTRLLRLSRGGGLTSIPATTTGTSGPVTTTTSTSSKTTSTEPTTTAPSNGVTTPLPIQDGMVSNCDAFYFVKAGDGCASIAAKYDITVEQFVAWNPAVGPSCVTLWSSTYACVSLI
jgi:hypothetical protein